MFFILAFYAVCLIYHSEQKTSRYNKVIVSGHQRVRACKELGITEILAEVRVYDNEDKIIKDLLETNVRQRGNIGGSSVKLGRRIRELERIYGIHNGGNDKVARTANGETGLSQEDLAKQLGMVDREKFPTMVEVLLKRTPTMLESSLKKIYSNNLKSIGKK